MKILVAEDNAIERLLLCSAVEALGHEVIAAADGNEALRLIETEGAEVVISDWLMPGLTGSELCQRIRGQKDRPYTYFMFLTMLDEHQNATGDLVPRRTGEVLRSAFRDEDIVARWGGEEFLVGTFGMAGVVASSRLELAIQKLSTTEFTSPSGTFEGVTFSGGVAQYPNDGVALESLFSAADAALYDAKTSGRARVHTAPGTPEGASGSSPRAGSNA